MRPRTSRRRGLRTAGGSRSRATGTGATRSSSCARTARMSSGSRVRRRTRTRPPGDARGRRLRFHRLRIAAAILVVLAGAAAAIAVAFGSWTGAQLRAVVVLSITQKTPTAAWAVRLVTDKPRIEEMRVAGLPATVVRPGEGNGPWPAVVFVNGATRRGRHHPKVQRLARGLARAGFLAVVPDLPGLSLGAITPATTAAAIRVGGATAPP